MASSSLPTYADWKAPADDGSILVWPDVEEMVAQLRHDHQRLSQLEIPIQGIHLSELRDQQRRWVGHHDPATPVIASGHQAELYHPGVWAKDVLANALARRAGGEAYHFVVDTDQPKHLQLRWPGVSLPVTDDASLHSAPWTAALSTPSPAHLQTLRSSLADAQNRWPFTPLLDEVFSALRRQALDTPDLAQALTNATHQLDWKLGLRHHAMVTSPIFASQPYMTFVHHVLARSGAFAADYNAALAEYRRANGVRSPMRPMPDLARSETSCEAPFWLDNLSSQSRSRPHVHAATRGFLLKLPNGAEFHFDPDAKADDAVPRLLHWLRKNNLRLSPRALVLTLYLRLFLADMFIHGIGGGRYDQVTDALIRKQFAIAAPRFAVTTATLYFPEVVGRARACVPCILQEMHQMRHRVLGEQKRRYLDEIAAAPRKSIARQKLFFDMHRQLDRALSTSAALSESEVRLRKARASQLEEEQLFDRELFYALQPADRLNALIDQYDSLFTIK